MEYLRKKYICKNQIKKGLVGVKETMEIFKQATQHCFNDRSKSK